MTVMFLVRSAFWIALIIWLIPSDPAKQAQMYETASTAIHRAATFCDRNATVCESAENYWGIFKDKAAVGAHMLGNLINERLAPSPTPRVMDGSARRGGPPALERVQPASDTLRPSDRVPEWRSNARTQL
ncbi:MAG: hypothetical protein AB7E81_15495 [Hyphomicrobiaceae bacterium]